ncbi:Predicted N-acyltransferase, GNAT family [Halomicrobium zhouii]|uniref:Predicted N-acyltransferase, GNAT family n=1 Tax=Halomicrobium zhouii TaxID=767519 RepID=A0A1I6LU17_9EURY|nr:GNAT family N-acetyltransferase [Halomicrobium zhouii]SFS06977.1 Predicted N-acyltransferase, GNAT family [Halomicrobium zhouii]
MTETSIDIAADAELRDQAIAVREEVFVEGQGVPPERERDGHDDDATHLLAREGGTPIGTARLRRLDDDTAKVERVAVREPYRGGGWGRRLVNRVEAVARERNVDTLVLHSQTAVEEFYERLGYETTSDVFQDAGIAHVEMEKSLE